MKKRIGSILMALALALSLPPTAAWAAEDVYADLDLVGTPSDYSDADNWLTIPEITKPVDTVYFYSTAYADPTEGADDTGVIVSWNTEGPGNKDANNFVVEAGAVSINPINWKRDNTYAPASENLGSRSQNEAGEWAVGAGIINGSGGMLSPKAIVTRAQAAAIFMRYADATTPIRVIDMEHHYYAQAFLDAAEKRAEVPRYNSKTREIEYVDGVVMNLAPIMGGLLSMDDERIAQMDAAGITAAMLETSPGLEQIGGAEDVALCKACNDLVYETMQKYPGRFCGSATLPVWDVEASVAELERCVKEYGFVSWHTHSNYGGTYIDGEVYRPLLKKCAELGVYVYIHPTMPANERLNERGVNFSAAGLGFTLDTMTTITAMITRGVFDEIPDLHVVSGHFGEALPFLLTRMDFHFGAWKNDPMLLNQHDISYYFKHNIWVTTSGNMSAEAFQLTKEVMGIERIMVGTDHPYENMAEEMAFLESLDLTRAEREALYYKNAAALMGVGG